MASERMATIITTMHAAIENTEYGLFGRVITDCDQYTAEDKLIAVKKHMDKLYDYCCKISDTGSVSIDEFKRLNAEIEERDRQIAELNRQANEYEDQINHLQIELAKYHKTGRKKSLDPAQAEKLKEQYQNGVTQRQLSKMFDISLGTVNKYLRNTGV